MAIEEIRVLGVKVHNISFDETISQIESFIAEKSPHLIITLGTEMVMNAQKDLEFKQIIEAAPIVCPDGIGLIFAGKRYGYKMKEKVAGVELVEKLVALSGKKGWNIFFLGAAEGVAEKAKQELLKKYPDAKITGTYHGYFKEDVPVLEAIKKAEPDIIFVALGSPKQERWYNEHAKELGIPVGIGVGGSFDVHSGQTERAPKWMIKCGLEWLYRLYSEPARWKRMCSLPIFALKVLLTPNANRSNK